ncbi:hypothetical protein SIO17_02885 [Pseudoalteromonas piscicida]|uniref:DUF4386 domain-containing protein n=2 Tax=Pseudoalteromonas piscicida TaxID=43662 RepID=A0ABM6NAZ6_PSEO7|nr:hypothetical protein [Pseudoalteromonas piscicida]ATD05937.1 hypothetical protein PPIS_a0684 [Pseudoalteromonas piscicida]WPU32716.1 hypothetical protein SIO17_02885 [Pseudoalteromonas piscicida]
MDQYKTKFVVVYLIAAIITAACLLMNGPMRPGLPLDNTVIMRMEFIAENLVLWQWSWIAWMFSALGLLVFSVILAGELKADFRKHVGLLLVALGVVPDLIAEVIYAFVLPKVVHLAMGESVFLLFEHIATHLTGYLGNGLYNLGGLTLTCLAIKQDIFKTWVSVWGITAWILGLLLSVSIAASQLKAAEIFTASSMTLSTLWMIIFAHQVLRPRWNTQS